MINNYFKLIILCLCLLNSAALYAFSAINAFDFTASITSTTNAPVPITITITNSTDGTLLFSLDGTGVGQYGILTMTSSASSVGTFSYSLNNASVANLAYGQVVTDVFNYTVTTSSGGFASSAKIIVQITGAQSPVIANNLTVSTSSSTTTPVTGNVATNDICGSGSGSTATCFVILDSSPVGQYGILSAPDTKGDFSYALNSQAVANLTYGQVVTDVFNYTYKSTEGFSATAQLIIQIIGNPIAANSPKVNNVVATMILSSSTIANTINIPANVVNATGTQASYLVSSPIGKYGIIPGIITGVSTFTYTLDTTNPTVSGLADGQSLTEVFTYALQVGTSPEPSDPKATITIYIYSQQEGTTNQNVELKPNDVIHPTSLNSGQYMRGQILNTGDQDWYSITSASNEIIHLTLCPQGSTCYNDNGATGRSGDAWVMYVFDGDLLGMTSTTTTIPPLLTQTYPLYSYPETMPSDHLTTVHSSNLYLLYTKNLFSLNTASGSCASGSGSGCGALIGIIDPCFSASNTLDIAGTMNKTYYIAISPPLGRSNTIPANGAITECNAGDVVITESVGVTPDPTCIATASSTCSGVTTSLYEEYLYTYPFSTDQYTIEVTRSGANPLLVSSPDQVTYNSVTGIANIPKVRVNNQIYSAQLKQGVLYNTMTFDIFNLAPLNYSDFANPYVGSYNPIDNTVTLPSVVVEQTGLVYSVKLLYHPDTNTLQYQSSCLLSSGNC